jgi:hypothetical protein
MTMKRISAIISLLTLSVLLMTMTLSCASSSDITASLGKEFTLPVGKKVAIEGQELTIKFVDVISDSRCPKGVECIQAGEAQCRMVFTLVGSPAEMVIVQPGGSGSARDYFIQYKIDFRLEPYPQEGQQIAPSEYKLVVTVTIR